MELMYPWVLIIAAVVVIVLVVFRFRKKDKYEEGKKVANTYFVKESPQYKKLMLQYKIFTRGALAALLIAIMLCSVLIARITKLQTIETSRHNRDIFICMDVSSSVDELNLEICGELKKMVTDLKGERIGITIFNAKSVLLIPLTTDYEYVLEMLDKLEDSFSLGYEDLFLSENSMESYMFKYEGTLSDEGSSYIGDGLASCLYNFPDLEENPDRTRMIVFTTDNELNGEPMVTIDKAAELCESHDVKVYAIAPEYVTDEAVFRDLMNNTGGGYYNSKNKNAVKNIVRDIQKTEASEIINTETIVVDYPEALFIGLLVSCGVYFIFSRRVKL